VGEVLGTETAFQAMVQKLLPLARVVTPNSVELRAMLAATHSNQRRDNFDEIDEVEAAYRLIEMGVEAVVVTGGHRRGEAVDVVVESSGVTKIAGPRLVSQGTRGGGCTYATALAVSLAAGYNLAESARRAQAFVQKAIAAARAPGTGEGRVVPQKQMQD